MEINNLILLSDNISSQIKENNTQGSNVFTIEKNKILIKQPKDTNNNNFSLNKMYMYLTKLSNSIQKELDITDLMLFYTTPLKKDQFLSCNLLERDGNYFLYSNPTEIFMLSAFKIRNKLRYNYIISCDHYKDSNPYCLGRINSNISNSEFILYDNGSRPIDSSSSIKRQYLLEVQFNQKSPFKQATVFFPYNHNCNDDKKYYNNDKDKKDKLSLLSKSDDYIQHLDSLNPEWSSLYNSYIQKNNSSRIREASKKNFQIGLRNKEREIVIECGKINQRVYALDFKMPFSPIQAFAIALSFIL